MSSNQELPNSNYNPSSCLDGGAPSPAGSRSSDGAEIFTAGLSAGPDVGYARNASLRSAGGAHGSERSVCWAKSGKGHPTTTVTTTTSSPYGAANKHATSTLHRSFDIELTPTVNKKTLAASGPAVVAAGAAFGITSENIIDNNGTTTTTFAYPPSPPAGDVEVVNPLASVAVAAIPAQSALAKPLTIANVSALPVTGGSPFSDISTVSGGEIESSSDEEDGASSELSFSSSSSASAVSAASSAVSATSAKDHRFLSSVFGASYNEEFAKLGVQVTSPSREAFEELELCALKGAAILSVPALGTKTLYLGPKDMSKLDRETLVDLVEIADEDLDCSGIVICLDKSKTLAPLASIPRRKESSTSKKHRALAKEELAETLHALMYVGGAIVPPDAGVVKYNSQNFVLVGLDL